MAFQSVNIELTEPRSFAALPRPVHMGVGRSSAGVKGLGDTDLPTL